MIVTLKRLWMVENRPTAGILFTPDKSIICASLELPWLDNRHNVSCIPEGSYPCDWDNSRGRYWVHNVLDRDAIQIHVANITAELKGCIAVGFTLNFPSLMLGESAAGLRHFRNIVGDHIRLNIERL